MDSDFSTQYRYSASAAKWQVQFFKQQSAQVLCVHVHVCVCECHTWCVPMSPHTYSFSDTHHMYVHTYIHILLQSRDFYRELIKRAKAWRDHMWPRGSGGTGRPSSYLISLLVARAFEKSQKKMGVFSAMSPETLAQQ